jgi:transcriptional regulator with XRE-family HTH domain
MDGNHNTPASAFGRARPTPRDRARELGTRVRQRRKALGLSQEQLGEVCELHRTYIGQIERGEVNVSMRNLVAVAEGLGIDVGELVQGIGRVE